MGSVSGYLARLWAHPNAEKLDRVANLDYCCWLPPSSTSERVSKVLRVTSQFDDSESCLAKSSENRLEYFIFITVIY